MRQPPLSPTIFTVKRNPIMSTVKLAVVQMSCSDVLEENLDKAEHFVREAAGAGANIVLLQELFENLYFPQLERDEMFETRAPGGRSPLFRTFRQPRC